MQDQSVTIANFITVEDLQNIAASIPPTIQKGTSLTIVFDNTRIYLKDASEDVIITYQKRSPIQCPVPGPGSSFRS